MASDKVMPEMRRLTSRYDGANAQLDDYLQRGMRGEPSDAAEFFSLVQKRQTSQQAMEATLKLHEKPIKTVLSESR